MPTLNESSTPWGILTGIRPAKLATKLLIDGYTQALVMEYFKDEYKTTPEKAALALEVANIEMPIREGIYKDGVSLYIGVPFCPSRCLYCSFITNATKQAAAMKPEYVRCLKKEISYCSEIIKDSKKRIETVYIGGGTPTALSANQLDEIITALYADFDLSNIKEFTVEAGRPDTVTVEKLKVLKKHKIDRISINPQTMHQSTLDIIGRAHTPGQICDAVKLARECGFDNINMDVIAGLPGENFEMFAQTLKEVAALSPENITVHTMCIKRSSRLKIHLDEYDLTKGLEVSKMVDYAKEFMAGIGMHPYYLYRQKNQLGNLENVGYSLPNRDCLYNIYIMEEIQSILSLGCGGVTKTVDRELDKIERIFNVKEPKDYIERIDEMLERKNMLRGEL
ncbi:MAG: coproporphyrinogen dehydrogenase HemZ [Oscillospiraceae bacterium]